MPKAGCSGEDQLVGTNQGRPMLMLCILILCKDQLVKLIKAGQDCGRSVLRYFSRQQVRVEEGLEEVFFSPISFCTGEGV